VHKEIYHLDTVDDLFSGFIFALSKYLVLFLISNYVDDPLVMVAGLRKWSKVMPGNDSRKLLYAAAAVFSSTRAVYLGT